MKKLLILAIVAMIAGSLAAQQVQQQSGGKTKMKRNWEKEYYEMEKQYESAQSSYQTAKSELGKFKAEVQSLKKDNSSLRNENSKLKKENASLIAENEDLKDQIAKMKKGGKVKELKKID